ncbi:hypothetical protein BC629DRAFT_1594063 [Irpex lacteus]|nr:hypothetical protein BC629DRAFT_1594063 [Irpex lacteus]
MSMEGITRHPDLWFDDGTVILIAETTGFRVYRGLLVRHSDIFRDMFLLPQPTSEPNGHPPDCPIVRLADDSAEEVAILLNILCNGVECFTNGSQRIESATAVALIRLGTKYAFHALQKDVLRRVSVCYPKDLKDLQSHGEDLCDSPDCPIIWGPTDCIAILHLTNQLNLHEYVPAALYKCANHVSLPQLLIAFNNPTSHNHSLSSAEFQYCITAREYLSSENAALYRLLSELEPYEHRNKRSKSMCAKYIQTMVAEAHTKAFSDGRDVLDRLDNWILSHEGDSPSALCSLCAPGMVRVVEEKQQDIWSRFYKRYGPACK